MTRSSLKRRLAATLTLAFATLLVVGLLAPASEAAISWKKKIDDKEIKVTFYGFGQFEIRQGSGLDLDGSHDGIRFRAQRVRLGSNYFHGKVFAKLFLDFNQSHSNTEAGLPKMIKDAFVGYKFTNAAFIKVGMFKAPNGMSFTIPGWNLDNIERSGLDKSLVLERDFGLMLSGRLIGGGDQNMKVNGTEMGHERWGKGFGYDIGIFNPAGRSSAVTWDSGSAVGDALAYAVRFHYDYTTWIHAEASYGKSEQAGGAPAIAGDPLTEDYEVIDVGVNSFLVKERLNLKGEYISGENIRGFLGRDQKTIVLTVGYRVIPTLELIVKHYDSSATRRDVEPPVPGDPDPIPDSDLSNTYVGLSWYLDPLKDKPRTLQNHRIQLNYVFTGGDDNGAWTGLGGYQDSVILAQYQYKF